MAEADTQVLPVENANLEKGENPNPTEDAPSSSNTPFVVKRLVGQRDKLREDNAGLDTENDDLAKEVARLTQENKLLAQSKPSQESTLPPDPDEFESREEYRQAQAKYTESVAKNAVGQVLNSQVENNRNVQFDSKVDDHYQQAEKLAKPDYEQAELNTINELGQNFVNGVVGSTDNSAEVLYMLGNSPEKMKRIKTLLASNPGRAAVEIGVMSASAGSFNKETLPAPEDTLEPGGVIPSAAHANLQKLHDDAVVKAAETGDSRGLRKYRKQMREAGLL
jgi:uncharacterized protein (DUF305 family)